VGTDPNTDIAVLRIAENNLPFIKLGNSDQLKVGQWVVAVGNPFNLTSTVTVGIVSALGRNIDLIRSNGNQYAIENFIQTDAAINPGNSGGALVNTQGELIGINTAIASETGSYAGYAFAVPVNLVEKVFNDITQYGKVQRAILGVSIQDISQNLADEKNLKDLNGVYVAEVVEKGAADKAGIQSGDVLLKINSTAVNSSSKLQETIGKFRPGDEVQVTLRRKGKEMVIPVILLSTDGKSKPELAERESSSEAFGMELINTTREERLAKSIKTGVKVKSVGKGVFKDAGIPNDFIITHINNQPVYSAAGAVSQLKSLQGAIVLEGLTSGGEEMVFGVKLPKTSDQ
jgi:S1-C subfamily serine protease